MATRLSDDAIRRAIPGLTEITALDGGGQGDVWRIKVDGRDEFLKVLRPGVVDRTELEIAALRAVDSDRVMRFYDEVEITEGSGTVVAIRAEFVTGGTVATRLAADELASDDLLAFARGLLEGVDAVHAKERAHRDLKPENLALRNGNWSEPVLLDLGLSRDLLGTSVTRYPGSLGTAPFMAPEQLRGERAPRRADIFAAAIVIFVAATGRHPFLADDETLTADQLLERQETGAIDFSDIDDELAAILEGAFAFEASQRPRARKMLEELEAVGTVSSE